MSFGIFWNIESGAVAFLTFLVLDIYLEYDLNKKIKLNIIRTFTNFLVSLLVLIICSIIFFTFIKIRSEFWPTFEDFFYFQHLFVVGCIGADSCPKLHSNMIIMIMFYLLGVSYGIKSLFSGNKDKLNSAIFLISVFGMGTSIYYFFKSYHIGHEGYALYPILILITLFSRRLFLNINATNYLNFHWLKKNYLNVFYLFIATLFINSFVSIFVFGYNWDTNFTATNRYHEIIYPKKTNWKPIGKIKLNDFEADQYKFDFLRVSDLADGNPKGLFPYWIVKWNKLDKYRSRSEKPRKDLLIFSNYDYFLYLKLNAKAPLSYPNYNHIWFLDLPAIRKGIADNKDIKYIIWDDDLMSLVGLKEWNKIIKITKKHFSLVEEIEGSYMFFHKGNGERGFAKEKIGWHKNVMRVFKRKL